jgi:putative SOS response-associated peptidase YedK
MCGRYTVARIDRLVAAFPRYRFPADARPRYNIAPTDPVLALRNDGGDAVEWLRWGLVPSWLKEEESSGPPLINARLETLTDRPAWKRPLRERRCLIFADGFYEWRRQGAARHPYHFSLAGGRPFAFAGLWDRRFTRGGPPLESCAIVTGPPNEAVAPIHDRMPVILAPDSYGEWLHPGERDPAALIRLLRAASPGDLKCRAVSSRVNSVRNDDASLLEPLT